MVSFFEASMPQLSVNWVGNKTQDEGYVLSEQPVQTDTLNAALLMNYFIGPFAKVNQVYNLYHPTGNLSLNPLHELVTSAFADPLLLNIYGRSITLLLHDVSNHPKIKSGELYVALFNDIQIEGELLDAIGIFKSETKETYLKVSHEKYGFGIDSEKNGININGLDKGCLIFNTDKEEGYKVLVVDNGSSKDAIYWMDEFIGLRVRDDSYSKTAGAMRICKSFILDKLPEEYDMSSADKADLLNKSLKYFKEKENFDLEEVAQEVFKSPAAVSSFKAYKSIYADDFDLNIPDSFDISGAAVKKQARKFKSIIKLDRNFQIHIHGSRDMIEKGFDTEKDLNYYKVYFKDEA